MPLAVSGGAQYIHLGPAGQGGEDLGLGAGLRRTFSPESLTTVPTEAAKDGVITAVTARIQAASFAVRALDRCMVGFLRSLFTQYRLYRDEGAYLPLSARSSQTAATSIAA